MGTWGPKLYQDDLAESIRNTYKDQLKRGKIGVEITDELLKTYEMELLDSDDAPIFWFALADTQWNLGRLEERVKKQALYYLNKGDDLLRWKYENEKNYKKREEVLIELTNKLLSPQPEEKKIAQYKLYKCQWEIGDVYAYELLSEHAKEKNLYGEYFLFHKVGERMWWPGHIVPIVRVKITKNKRLPKNVEEFDKLEYVQTGVKSLSNSIVPIRGVSLVNGKEVDVLVPDECGILPCFRLTIISTSKRIIPKTLLYAGNYKNVLTPPIEFIFDEEIEFPSYDWKSLENQLINRYFGYNLRESKVYKKD